MKSPKVEIIIGSESDREKVEPAFEILNSFGIPYNFMFASAHRTPDLVIQKAKSAKDRKIFVIIAAAGGAAHLAGLIAAHTQLPVIGVPLSSKLNGIDSLLSTLQMPSGVPVATVNIDGAINAALLALQIIALSDLDLYNKLIIYRQKMAAAVLESNKNND